MIPIQELLSRIRWDPEFGAGEFRLGYYDRLEDRIIVVPLSAVSFPDDAHSRFELTDAEGTRHSIPLHRVRQVYRDGRLIWQRPRGR